MKEIIKELDLRNMPPFERHAKIFQMWDALKDNEILKIINDHDPKPLYYHFLAEYENQFEWQYEKQGPKDWIFKIKKIKNNKAQVKELLKQLHSGADKNKIKEQGKTILKNISPTDLALIEQEMIHEGLTRNEMRKLCDVHLEVMKEGLEKTDAKKANLKPGHVIHTLTEEHKMILDFINKLQSTINILKSAKDFNKVKNEIGMLKHIAEHLVEADKHHQREEEALFPELEKSGITEPPEIMKEEHIDLKARKKELYKTVKERAEMNYSDFLKKIIESAGYIIENLPAHIYKEDNILYPMALQVIPKSNWKEIKKKCDKIGYCCFTPKY